jgi:hypothetical protein
LQVGFSPRARDERFRSRHTCEPASMRATSGSVPVKISAWRMYQKLSPDATRLGSS